MDAALRVLVAVRGGVVPWFPREEASSNGLRRVGGRIRELISMLEVGTFMSRWGQAERALWGLIRIYFAFARCLVRSSGI